MPWYYYAGKLYIYRVGYEDFFRFENSPNLKRDFSYTHALCHESMTQLIRKYNLQKKAVLSVGASLGYQEYCFYEHGGSLTLCDIDEYRIIEPYIKTLSHGDLSYALGDARELKARKFNVVFFSSFTPNELQNRHKSKVSRFIGRPRWYDTPFIDVVIDIVNNSLDVGGLFIYQSYASDVDARKPGYITALRKQLEPIGIQLLDVYYYESYPHVHMIVAVRGDALAYFKHVQNNPDIVVFHGRGEPARQSGRVKKSYSVD